MFRVSLPLLLVVIFGVGSWALPGCERRQVTDEMPIQQTEYEAILAILYDMSGSYFHQIKSKAFPFSMAAVDGFFRGRIGSKDKIVISQLSAKTRALLW